MGDTSVATDWRSRITVLCGGDTLEAMEAFLERRKWRHHTYRQRNHNSFRAQVNYGSLAGDYVARYGPTPAEALARAILAAATEGR